MTLNANICRNEELAVFRLRSLYRACGYAPYKMSKFEEYDLYARNKHFLLSENVITFTDTDGKLMALKPDVTLSIVKNTKETAGEVQKLYYDENVYRVSKGTRVFRELTQVGLECIGDVDDFCVCEVLALAADSLAQISEDFVLDVSDLSLLGAVMDTLQVSESAKAELLHCIGEKNTHGVREIARREGADEAALAKLCTLIGYDLPLAKGVAALRAQLPEYGAQIAHLEGICSTLGARADKVRLDFSVVNDMSYYNGIVFKGFVNGVPAGVLSGGQYDGLMQKMGRKARAIGFAVYLDLLERFGTAVSAYDTDAVLLYKDGCDLAALSLAADRIRSQGKRTTVCKKMPDGLKYKELYAFENGEVKTLEADA
ncbi:MAG: ATP phosphoribosyltransferase regulatory subunit [Clostridia bacterium]|nr:ATP phosphoribosyltransferase regulatory subunit [Clostridia bacterium]